MPPTLHTYVPLQFYYSLHIDPTILHISKINKLQHLLIKLLQNIQQICPQMAKIWHMPKLLDMNLWGKYANIHVTYEVASIDNIARIALRR